jgi:predicted solute-binding protein
MKTTTRLLPDLRTRVALPFDVVLGSVPYFNATPLTCALAQPLGTEHPSALSESLRTGSLDGALVPIVECLRSGNYQLVDEVAIASDGAVHSVFLALHKPIAEVKRVALDPASVTSRCLTRVILEIFLHLHPVYVKPGEDADAELWIGDQALAYRKANPSIPLLDLGQAWKDHTGLPFIFAVWALRPGIAGAREVADSLRKAQILGLAQRARLCQTEDDFKYLMDQIRYDVGVAEKQGLDLFSEHLLALGEISQKPHLNWI